MECYIDIDIDDDTDEYDYDDEIYLKVNDNYQKYLYPYNGPPTKISFDILKKAWYKALNEIIEITENISDDTLVCIASY